MWILHRRARDRNALPQRRDQRETLRRRRGSPATSRRSALWPTATFPESGVSLLAKKRAGPIVGFVAPSETTSRTVARGGVAPTHRPSRAAHPRPAGRRSPRRSPP